MKIRMPLPVVLTAVLLAAANPAIAQNQPAAENPLNQLAWLTGGKWVAEGEKGPDGNPFHVESTIDWGDNGRVIQFTTRFRKDGKLVPVYTGIYAWHPAKKTIVFMYTDNHGSLTEGEATASGDRLEQQFQIINADGVAHPFRSTIIRRGPDEYDWAVLRQKEGSWEEMFGLKYKRRRD